LIGLDPLMPEDLDRLGFMEPSPGIPQDRRRGIVKGLQIPVSRFSVPSSTALMSSCFLVPPSNLLMTFND